MRCQRKIAWQYNIPCLNYNQSMCWHFKLIKLITCIYMGLLYTGNGKQMILTRIDQYGYNYRTYLSELNL